MRPRVEVIATQIEAVDENDAVVEAVELNERILRFSVDGEDAAQETPEMTQEAADPQPEEFPQDEADAADEPAKATSVDDTEKEEEPIPETMEIHYDVPGSARKALASAIGEIIGTYPSYQAAPSFAYIIGEYTLDRNGVLTGPRNSQLMLTLDQDGYRTK